MRAILRFTPRNLVFVLAMCLLAGPSSATEPPPGWKLLFSDDFQRTELGEEWKVVEGKWLVQDGSLVGSGVLISAKGFPATYPPGFQRLEFDVTTESPEPKTASSERNAFIHAQPPEKSGNTPSKTGYCLPLGGQNLYRNGTALEGKPAVNSAIDLSKTRHIILENDRGKLKAIIDGSTVFELSDDKPIMGTNYDRVGFYFGASVRINNVRVYVKELENDYDVD